MNVKLTFLLSVVFLIIISCTKKKDINYYRDFSLALKESQLYSKYDIDNFVANDEMAMWSDEYLSKAKAIEAKSPDKSIYYLKRSISLSPSIEAYIMVSNLLLKLDKYVEAKMALNLIISKFCDQVEPQTFVNYLYAYIKSSDNPYEMYGANLNRCENVSISFEDKQEIKTIILNDIRFKELTENVNYKEMICMLDFNDLQSSEIQNTESVAPFDSFLVQFPVKNLELIIGINELQNFSYGNLDYEMMDGPGSYCNKPLLNFNKYYPISNNERWQRTNTWGQLDISQEFKTLIFAYDTSAPGTSGNLRCIDYKIVTYTNDGDIIDEYSLGVHAGEKLVTSTIKDSIITVNNFTRKWKLPFRSNDIDNEVEETILNNAETVIIGANGKFKKQNSQ